CTWATKANGRRARVMTSPRRRGGGSTEHPGLPRFTAGAFGFLPFIRCCDRRERSGEPSRFETIHRNRACTPHGIGSVPSLTPAPERSIQLPHYRQDGTERACCKTRYKPAQSGLPQG